MGALMAFDTLLARRLTLEPSTTPCNAASAPEVLPARRGVHAQKLYNDGEIHQRGPWAPAAVEDLEPGDAIVLRTPAAHSEARERTLDRHRFVADENRRLR